MEPNSMVMETTTRERRWWTRNEDEILRNAAQVQINEHGTIKNWNDLAVLLPGRTNKDCRKRWSKVRLDIRKGAWTPEEDDRLRQAVAQVGFKWSAASEMLQTRNADQCAKRWQHVLGPTLKHGPWTPEEDRILQDAIAKHGNKWKQIGISELPGRSAHDIRNRGVALSRRRRRSETMPTSPRPTDTVSGEGTADYGDNGGDSGDGYSGGDDSEDMTCVPSTCLPSSPANADYEDGGKEVQIAPPHPNFMHFPVDHTFPQDVEMVDPTGFLDADCNPWAQFANPVNLDLHTTDPNLFSAGTVDDRLLDFGLPDAGDARQGELPQPFQPERVSSPGGKPQVKDRARKAVDAKGRVTIVMGQADLSLAQKVIGSLKELDADLTLHLLRD